MMYDYASLIKLILTDSCNQFWYDKVTRLFDYFSSTWDTSLPIRLNQDLQREDGM